MKDEKNERNDGCSGAALTLVSDYSIFPKIYEKIGNGQCCRIEPIKRRVVITGDIEIGVSWSNTVVTPLDVCFLDGGENDLGSML